MGSHMRLMDPSDPPWLLNQSVKLTLSRALTLRMPPSGSTRALTMGDVPKANELAACITAQHTLSLCKYNRAGGCAANEAVLHCAAVLLL